MEELIQFNPFCLKKVDKLFFNQEKKTPLNENIIIDYFEYINSRINNDSIFRLLSPLLQIFFDIPNGKNFKTEIHEQMKNYELKKLESLFLKFIKKEKLSAIN